MAPHVLSWRRARGAPDLDFDEAALARAIRCGDAGYRDWVNAAVHLVVAGRATCTRVGATYWAREQLRGWLDALDDARLDELADELVAEAAAIASRHRTDERTRAGRAA